jgi:hypothetical protein
MVDIAGTLAAIEIVRGDGDAAQDVAVGNATSQGKCGIELLEGVVSRGGSKTTGA